MTNESTDVRKVRFGGFILGIIFCWALYLGFPLISLLLDTGGGVDDPPLVAEHFMLEPELMEARLREIHVETEGIKVKVYCENHGDPLAEYYYSEIPVHLEYSDESEVGRRTTQAGVVLMRDVVVLDQFDDLYFDWDVVMNVSKEILNYSNGYKVSCTLYTTPMKVVVSEYLAFNGTINCSNVSSGWRFIQNITFYETNYEIKPYGDGNTFTECFPYSSPNDWWDVERYLDRYESKIRSKYRYSAFEGWDTGNFYFD